MEQFTQSVIIDFNPNSPRLVIFAKQGDAGSRTLHINFTKNGETYNISDGNTIILRLRKPDGGCIKDSYQAENGAVDIILSSTALSAAGRAFADLAEIDGEEHVLSTATFIINIVASPVEIDQTVVSSDEYDAFMNFIGAAERRIEDAQAWANGSRGSTPVPADDSAYHNNAKYWADSIGDKYQEIAAMNINVSQAQNIIPGAAPEIAKATDSFTFTMTPPVVNIHASASAVTGSQLKVEATMSNYLEEVEAPQISRLQQQLNLNFTFPNAWSSNVEVTTNLDDDHSNYAADASAVGTALGSAASAYQAIMSNGAVKIENGGTGATDSQSALASLGAQRIIQTTDITLNNTVGSEPGQWSQVGGVGDWFQTVTISSNNIDIQVIPNFIASPNNRSSWVTAADVTLGPPEAALATPDWALTFECTDQPLNDIDVTVYWW